MRARRRPRGQARWYRAGASLAGTGSAAIPGPVASRRRSAAGRRPAPDGCGAGAGRSPGHPAPSLPRHRACPSRWRRRPPGAPASAHRPALRPATSPGRPAMPARAAGRSTPAPAASPRSPAPSRHGCATAGAARRCRSKGRCRRTSVHASAAATPPPCVRDAWPCAVRPRLRPSVRCVCGWPCWRLRFHSSGRQRNSRPGVDLQPGIHAAERCRYRHRRVHRTLRWAGAGWASPTFRRTT